MKASMDLLALTPVTAGSTLSLAFDQRRTVIPYANAALLVAYKDAEEECGCITQSV